MGGIIDLNPLDAPFHQIGYKVVSHCKTWVGVDWHSTGTQDKFNGLLYGDGLLGDISRTAIP